MKNQFITRVFLSSLVLALTSLFGGGNLLAQKVVFEETFDDCKGTGGNDKQWSGSIASDKLSDDYNGWTLANGYAASQCAKFGSAKNLGSATTPALNFEGAATLTFKAGPWKGDKTTLKISILNGGSFILNNESLSATTVTMKSGEWSEHEIAITGATKNSRIKFYQDSKARFFLDEVKITRASSGDPDDTRKNPELAYGVSEYNATIGQKEGFPTLTYADGVTGITYSSSNKTVAEVDESGNVTLKGIEGTTTIKASISNSQTWKDDEASYTLIVSKRSANLAYSASSCTVIVGETPELPTLSNPEGVEGIVYASSNTDVATVNETTGKVTLTGAVGTTVISATFEGNATFANGSASYTLTVTKTNTFRYKKVTATEELMAGGQYIIVCEDLNLAKGPGKETGSVEVNIDGKMIIPTESAALGVYTLEAKDGGYALKIVGDTKYLCSAGADKTGFLESETAVAWTVTIDENKNASIQCSTSDTRQILFSVTYSGTSYVTSCKNYASTNAEKDNYYKVQLYQKVYPLTVSSATGGYATFYNEEEAYKMPEGLTGYAVTKAEANDYITRKTAYEAGATVPAKTPLLIIGQADSYYPAVVSGTGVEAYAGSNLLEGARDANGNTQSAKENVYYYKLGLNTKGVPGFYWGAVGGAAFKMTKATTAYLAVPQKLVEGANALFFDFGPETGINEIQTEQADKAIFDLSGRRVQKATKGFYIVGGKKVLVK